MTADADLLALVQQSVRGFGAHHAARFVAVESGTEPKFARELLDEIVELGWLESLSVDEATSQSREAPHLLASLVAELAPFSPALSALILVHHYCRVSAVPSHAGNIWYGLDSSLGDPRFAPMLVVDESLPGLPLTGSMRLVIGGAYATHWLGLAQLSRRGVGLLLVPSSAATELRSVATLGLRGLGTVEAVFTSVSCEHYQLLAVGHDALAKIKAAYQHVTPSFLSLLRSLLQQTRRLANDHAAVRRQNGRLLAEIPAVEGLLEVVERTLALVRLTEQAFCDRPVEVGLLLDGVSKAAQQATDAGLQVLGGAGYIVGNGLEQLWRDTRQCCQLLPRQDW